MRTFTVVTLVLPLAIALAVSAQEPARPAGQKGAPAGKQKRAPLLFREDWKQFPPGGEHPVQQDGIANPNLELKLYGPSGKDIQLTGSADDESNPVHVWTGLCAQTCAVAFRDKNSYMDLSGLARVRWLTKVAGFHLMRPIVKLADGTWLVGDHTDGLSADWRETEFSLAGVRWRKLDIRKVVEAPDGRWIDNPDLSKVDEIGFTDLMPGSGHGPGGWTDLAWIEVYGKAAPRDSGAGSGSQNK